MENPEPPHPPISSNDELISKNTLIIILLVLLVFSFLGINLLNKTGSLLDSIKNIFGPIVSQILSIFGYTVGTTINNTTDVVTNVSKTGIDITHDTLHDVGDLMKNASQKNVNLDVRTQLDNVNFDGISHSTSAPLLDTKINQSTVSTSVPSADNTTSPIQNPISSQKIGWCLVGEYENRRGCIEVGQQDKCISGQIFPNQKACINPAAMPPSFLGTTSERGHY